MTAVTNNTESALSALLALFAQTSGSSSSATTSTLSTAETSGSGSATTAREAAVKVTLSERAQGVLATGSSDSSSGVAAAITAILDIVKRSKATGTAATDSTTAAGSSGTIWQQLDAYYGTSSYYGTNGKSTAPTSVGSVTTVGTVGTAGWSTTVTDVYSGPANLNDPQQVAQWYDNPDNIATAKVYAQSSDKDMQSFAKAFENRTLTIQNAYDVPGLNFHMSDTYFNNGTTSGETGSESYNSTAEMLNGKSNFVLFGNGVYVTW